MSVILASINDRTKHRGTVYCTTAQPMDGYERLSFLAPTWELVNGHKKLGKSDEWYVEGYRALLGSRERWPVVKSWLMSLRVEEDITLLCYCRAGKFCHRKLLAKMIAKWRPDIELEVY